MRQIIFLTLVAFLTNKCSCQRGFPEQFQAKLNITELQSVQTSTSRIQPLLYDYTNSRARFDITGGRKNQSETYMVQYQPKGAEAGSPASQGFTMFNFNPDYPELTKNNCWYSTNPMRDIGPFPFSWYKSDSDFEMKPWFPLPPNLIKKGEEWIPEVKKNATRYDSPEMCDLYRSGIGKVPCLSYFEAEETPVKTITAHAAVGSFDTDQYISTFYLSFTFGIPSKAEPLFNLPDQWPSYCGYANAGFTIENLHGFVVTPEGGDHFMLKLNGQPVHSLGDQVTVYFKVQPNWYYNGTRCAEFNSIVFDRENWQEQKEVDMKFGDYGCCSYAVTAVGGGYEWQYSTTSFAVYACDGTPGYGCTGKEPCGG
ncbi:unnamed protein product [Rotaria magnacalcarata]|uniref:Uncharacterized protein n=5 Tax=Rotaria magnacalcarata TaxID=392030 RepID=A0A816UE38_9BILA|nr:unnamed protein product [Rotaria magnacalcarata]CAF2112877.1 unnamed protein product [Rotaria magnacalcarata]CAF4252135.1 unnamed protein product [Rotaria magnacalcarata]CAF4271171.1 unnamed protein product [Rotaria magnacalcarata]